MDIRITDRNGVTLHTSKKFCEEDIYVTIDSSLMQEPPSGTLEITENGEYDVTNYASAEVNVASNGKGAAKLEYITRNGSGYIDTGIDGANSKLKIEVKYSLNTIPSGYWKFIHAYQGEAYDSTRILLNSNGPTYVCLNNKAGSSLGFSGLKTVGTIYTEILQPISDTEFSFTSNGTTVSQKRVNGTALTGKTILLFQDNSKNDTASVNVYYLKIFDDGVLVRDYIPYEQDGEYGLYDKVNDKFYGNVVNDGIFKGGFSNIDDVVIEELTITENGTYTAPDGVVGYSPVVVNVDVAKDSTMENGLITRALTEYTNNEVDNVGKYALSNFEILEKCVLRNAQTLNYYAFSGDTVLTHIDILGGGTLYGSLSSSCFLNCSNIKTLIMRNSTTVTKLSTSFFPYYTGQANITRNFTRANWDKYGTVGRSENWSGLTGRPTGSITYFTGTVTDEDSKPIWLFGEYTNNATTLKTLALAETEEEAATLMAQYEEQFMTSECQFYVPSIMVEQYKVATNWVNYASRIKAIEDYPEICD